MRDRRTYLRAYRQRNHEEISRKQKARYYAARNAWLEANGPCIDCGNRQDLQVDHVDRSKKLRHSIGWTLCKERLAAELEYCVVRCRPCHVRKTLTVDRTTSEHGMSRYGRGCRCSICRDANAARGRRERARSREGRKGELTKYRCRCGHFHATEVKCKGWTCVCAHFVPEAAA